MRSNSQRKGAEPEPTRNHKKSLNDKIHTIYAADFVSHESGTGIVHIAPAYGEDDFELGKANGIAPFHVIDDNGYYTDTNYKGLEVWDNNKFIAKDLKEKGMGGIMFWEYKCDPSGELLSFIKKNM